MAESAEPRARMRCPECDAPMRADGGEQTVDRWVERFVCEDCGRTEYRGYGRGSV